MSALAFATAPWAVATLYSSIRGRVSWQRPYIAVCIWMFSASWSYDLYILLRDGDYPLTWFSNIFASSVLYASAGLMWNLDWREGRGVVFAFTEPGWPPVADRRGVNRILWFALPFIALVAAMIVPFIL